jgi:hypothetical protein
MIAQNVESVIQHLISPIESILEHLQAQPRTKRTQENVQEAKHPALGIS